MNYPILCTLLLMGVMQSLWSQTINQAFFTESDRFFKTYVDDGGVNYNNLVNSQDLNTLIKQVADADLSGADAKTIQAFYINAYNLSVIKKVTTMYPVGSVMKNPQFFDGDKVKVAGEKTTLNDLEKTKLLQVYNDPRFHFVLVCGARGCPPITNFAYTPNELEAQLNQQTRLALNDPEFVKINGSKIELSQIFKWYTSDFGTSKGDLIPYINQYREEAISNDAEVGFYQYDWTLNNASTAESRGTGSATSHPTSNNAYRYVVSSTIPKGSAEIKIFNNLYSQQTGSPDLTDRSSFFTTTMTGLYGISERFNAGIHTRFRKVRNNPLPSSPFTVFGSGDDGSSRTGITAIGPMIRVAPVPQWSNFSIQSSLLFATGKDLTGNSEKPYIDWDGMTFWTQIFNDFSIGDQFSLFTELDFLIEDIGAPDDGFINRFSTPLTVIFSYIPTPKLTFYALSSYSPYWQENFDYFTQLGLGSKYQFTPNFEIEVLYSDFANKFLNDSGGQAETINLGFRINL